MFPGSRAAKVNRLLEIALAVMLFGLCFLGGYTLGDLQVKYIEKPVILYEYIDKEVEVVKVVEVKVEVEKLVELKDFTSLAELKTWLAKEHTDGLHYLFSSDDSGIYPNPAYKDCDDYAVALQRAAEEDSYRISVQVDTRKHHALNSVFIGDRVYFIEPQTDEVWLECYRD